jgi:hypothetical protein
LFFLDSHGNTLSETVAVTTNSPTGNTFFANAGKEQILFSQAGTQPKTFFFTDGNGEQILLSQPGSSKGGALFFFDGENRT